MKKILISASILNIGGISFSLINILKFDDDTNQSQSVHHIAPILYRAYKSVLNEFYININDTVKRINKQMSIDPKDTRAIFYILQDTSDVIMKTYQKY